MTTTTRSAKADPAVVAATLRAFMAPGDVFEVRVLKAGRAGTVSGYFNDVDKAAQAAAQWSGRAPGVYFTANPVNPALLARVNNRLQERAEQTTTDRDVRRRRKLLLDFDPVRPAGISATEEEHAAALAVARDCRDWLTANGWPLPIVGDSGNGGHMNYLIDLPNDDAARDLVKRVLEAVSFQFSSEAVKVDQTTYNAARIWKCYGTLAAKGDHTADRPHRMSALMEVPLPIVCVPRDLLEAVAALAPKPEPSRPASRNGHECHADFDLARWIQKHGLPVVQEGPWGEGGYRWILNPCPWNPDHTNRAAYIVRKKDGTIAAGCRHDGCSAKRWHDLRDLCEPGWRDRRKHAATHASNSVPTPIVERLCPELVSERPAEPEAEKEQEQYRVKLIDSPTFERNDYRQEWYVRHMLVRGQPCIVGAPKKCLKTSIVVDLALSLAAAVMFLGTFYVPRKVRVAVLSGESGEATLQTLARRVALAKGIDWPQVDCFWGFELPQLSLQTQLAALRDALAENKVDVLIYDPLYLGLLAGQGALGLSASNMYQMGPLLSDVAKVCLSVDVTPVLGHHF
jgi:hypothetical protein